MSAMQSQYGADKGKRVFYASRNAGKITGVDPESSSKKIGVPKRNGKIGIRKGSW